MEGRFEIQKLTSGDLTDEDFRRAYREGRIEALLKQLPVTARVRGHNRVFDNMAGYLLYWLFSMPSTSRCATHFAFAETFDGSSPPATAAPVSTRIHAAIAAQRFIGCLLSR